MVQILVNLDPSKFPDMEAIFLVKMWLNVYTFGEAYKDWIGQGNPPFFKEDVTLDFVTTILGHLEKGDIKIETLPENSTDAAAYNHKENTIFIPNENIVKPHMEKIKDFSSYMAILHELWHAYQDSQKRIGSNTNIEVEAEVFGMKAMLILEGEDKLRKSIRESQESFTQLAIQQLPEFQEVRTAYSL
ncbi:hypothetical protein K1X76_11360 [bacterium]|nr:hypothetical protein [bacterium]